MVFPPLICATSLRPDIVIWSKMSRSVILIELTCCAEEGINAAQQRKETRYAELMEQINLTNCKGSLLIGARGLVGSRTYHALVSLGILSTKVKKLCKNLSVVSARCSYSIYLAHKEASWYHKTDLIVVDEDDELGVLGCGL